MLVSQSEYARQSGFSRQYVNKLVRTGVIRLINKKIDAAQADAAIEAIREPAREQRRTSKPEVVSKPVQPPVQELPSKPIQSPAPPRHADVPTSPVSDLPGKASGDLPSLLLRARIKTEVKRGNLLDLDEKVKTKQFVEAEEVKVVAFNRGRVVRDRIMNLPDRLAAILAAENDINTVRETLATELRIALEGLSNEPIS